MVRCPTKVLGQEGIKHQMYSNVVTYFGNKSTQYFNEKDMTKIKLSDKTIILFSDDDYGKFSTMADLCVKDHFHQFQG